MGFSKTHYGAPKIQNSGDPQSWILTPKCRYGFFSKTKQFIAMMSVDVRKSYVAFSKSKMAEICQLENRHDVIFSASPIWIKFRRLVQDDMSTAVM